MRDKLSPFWKDILSGFLAFAFAIWLLIGCTKMYSFTKSLLQPDFLPRWLAYILIALGVITIALAFIKRKKNLAANPVKVQADAPAEKLSGAKLFNEFVPYLTFGLMAVYLWAMQKIGFTVASCLYLMLQINLLEQKRTPKRVILNCVVGICVGVAVFLIFRKGFRMHLPMHRWGSLGKF